MTLFITSFHPFISRNILNTGLLERLSALGNLKIVVLVPSKKIDFFRGRFQKGAVMVEGFDAGSPSRTLAGLFFKRAAKVMINTATARIQRNFKLRNQKKFFYYFFFALPLNFISRFRSARRLIRFLDFHFSPAGLFDDLLDRFQPSLIFSTDIQNENDVALMQDARRRVAGARFGEAKARRRSIKIVGMIRSWDNLTVHGLLRVLPDLMLVSIERLKELAVELHDYPEEKIRIVGIPHYDRYLAGPEVSKREFFAKLGLDPSKKTIFFAPVGDRYIKKNDVDRFMLEILKSLGHQAMVRFPPGDTVTLGDFQKPDNFFFDQPGFGFYEGNVRIQEISDKDDEMLANELAFCDVVVCGPSTIGIDGSVFGKPIIMFDFYPTERSYWEKIEGYDYDHIVYLLSFNAVRRVKSKDDFLLWLNKYLENPELDSEARRQLVEAYAFKDDGRATERLFSVLKEELERL